MTTPSTPIEQLRNDVCEALGVFPEELQYALPAPITTKRVDAIMSLFHKALEAHGRAERKDQIARLMGLGVRYESAPGYLKYPVIMIDERDIDDELERLIDTTPKTEETES